MITIGALILALLTGPTPSAASTGLALRVAECAGRLSAEVQFAWLANQSQIDRLEAQRDQMRDLLTALTENDAGDDLISAVIEAKYAQALLRQSAAFGTDDKRQQLARRQATLMLASCQRMLLDS